jgi:PIN domain nuclease of toxin-antitoxin system
MSSLAFDSLLLDTHIVIWMATKPARLPKALQTAMEKAKNLFVSHVSAWEIQIKHEKHGAEFGFSLPHLEEVMKAFACRELPVEYRDIRRLDHMRFVHQDPFDRLLMAQASVRPVYLATLDVNIEKTFKHEKAFSLFTDQPHSGVPSALIGVRQRPIKS